MKSKYLALLLLPAFAVGACTQEGVTDVRDAASSMGGRTTSGTGGNTGGPGGESGGGTGGATQQGTGGATVTGTGGATGAAGNTGGGVGGAVGTGGATVMGTGGSGTGGAAATITVADFAGRPNTAGSTFASSFIIVPCYGQMQQDCATIPSGMTCPNMTNATPYEQRGLTQLQTFTLGGVVGTNYDVTFTVNGVVEPKYYEMGTRDGGNAAVANAQGTAGTDTFYQGGRPVAVEFYNIYKLIVKNPAGMEVNHYYLNSMPNVSPFYENHQSFLIHYTKHVTMPGGGSVELFMGDSNCRAIDNCGPGAFTGSCSNPRRVPSEPNLVLPAMYMGRTVASMNVINGAAQPFHSQVIHITVDAVTKL